MKPLHIVGILTIIIISWILLSPIMCSSNRIYNNGIKTVEKIYTPSEMLKKYEWFKDMSSTLDRRTADISVYDNQLKTIETKYQGKEMPKWEQEYYNTKTSEKLGLVSSYNQLAAEYNSAMSKFNYRFCNVGDLPEGAVNPLPREFKPYITQ